MPPDVSFYCKFFNDILSLFDAISAITVFVGCDEGHFPIKKITVQQPPKVSLGRPLGHPLQ